MEEEVTPELPVDRLLRHLPKKKLEAATSLIDFLHAKKVKFNDRGELLQNGSPVKDSNMIDLFNYTVRDLRREAPKGWDVWREQLLSNNVPDTAIGSIFFFAPPVIESSPTSTPKSIQGTKKKQTGSGWLSLYNES